MLRVRAIQLFEERDLRAAESRRQIPIRFIQLLDAVVDGAGLVDDRQRLGVARCKDEKYDRRNEGAGEAWRHGAR